jgi:hypothetical protein
LYSSAKRTASATVRGFARPPTMIGGRGRWTGAGRMSSASAHWRVISASCRSSSSTRSRAVRNGNPYVSCSSSYQPAPIPSSTRPPETWSTVTTFFASTDAGRNVTGETIVPRRIRSVRAARAARVAQASSAPAGSPRTIER